MKSPNQTQETLSVIIATKDRIEHLRTCIESILRQSILPDEVVIIDGSVKEDHERSVQEFFRNAPQRMLNYSRSRATLTVDYNLGAARSHGELITFVDDDTILDERYIEHVKNFFAAHRDEHTGALSCKILDPDRRFAPKKNHFSVSNAIAKIFLLQCSGEGRFRLSGLPTLIDSEATEEKKVEFVYGGSATYRKRVFEEFKFDESLPGGFNLNDDDIAYRLSRKYQNYWTPRAFLYHRSHYVNNDRFFKSRSFIICHFYLRMKNYPKDIVHSAAFYWSILGRLCLESLMAVKGRNLSGVKGTFSGLGAVWFQGAHHPQSLKSEP